MSKRNVSSPRDSWESGRRNYAGFPRVLFSLLLKKNGKQNKHSAETSDKAVY